MQEQKSISISKVKINFYSRNLNLQLHLYFKKLSFIFLFFTSAIFGQTNKNPCEVLARINNQLQEKHYKPKAVDDSLSVYVFSNLLKSIDDDNRLFIEPEIKSLEKYKYKIDDAILNNDCQFATEIYSEYKKTIVRYSALINQIKNEPFPSSTDETIVFSKKTFSYLKSEAELKKLFRKRILFNTLRDVAEISKNKDSLKQNFDKLFAASKTKTIDAYSCKLTSLDLSQEEFNSLLYNSFCSYFDPHSVYFSQSDKSSFLSSVSAENFTFGLYVSLNEKDEISVNEIIPGSSAYFTEKIDAGDQVLKVKYKNEEFIISCTSHKKIEEIMTSDSFKNADFTLRKKSGEIYTVSLEKKIMKDYENNVYSYIIKKNNSKIGYIKIPSFYAIFENGKTNVSSDVTKEIYKLKKDGIDGLIIDVQNNGGGSMDEAVKLCGMFIDVGPVAVMNNRKNEKDILKDMIRGTVYNGKLVVLINGFSASASEFFANTMQDYNSGVIIGLQSYGKASMQQIFPLFNDKKPDEFLKITTEKFYRVTGKSNQYMGIKPDIEIPLLFNKQMPKERDEKTALKNDTIEVSVRYQTLSFTNLELVKENSSKRIQQNSDAQKINSLNTEINKLYDEDLPPIHLNFDSVFEQVNSINTLWKTIGDFNKKENNLDVVQNSTDLEYEKFDDFLKSNTIEKIKEIKTNLSIFEAINCIIELKN